MTKKQKKWQKFVKKVVEEVDYDIYKEMLYMQQFKMDDFPATIEKILHECGLYVNEAAD